MKHISDSVGLLFLGGIIGVALWAGSEGITVVGVPGSWIAISAGVLACAYISSEPGKSNDEWVKNAGALFVSSLMALSVIGAFFGANSTPVENGLFDPK